MTFRKVFQNFYLNYGPGIITKRTLPEKRDSLSTEVYYMNPWHAAVAFLFDQKIQKHQNNPAVGFTAFGLQGRINDEMAPSRINPFGIYAYGSMVKRNMNSQETKRFLPKIG